MGAFALDKLVKLRDPCLNFSREIPPEAVGGGIFDSFHDNFRPEVVSDVISGGAVEHVGVDVHVEYVDDSGQSVLEIFDGLIVCRTNMTVAYHMRQKRLTCVSPPKKTNALN